MERSEIVDKLSDILVEMFEVDKQDITLESRLYEDLDIDSIDAVDLVVRLKQWTNEKVSPEEFKNVRTVSDVVDSIQELLSRSS